MDDDNPTPVGPVAWATYLSVSRGAAEALADTPDSEFNEDAVDRAAPGLGKIADLFIESNEPAIDVLKDLYENFDIVNVCAQRIYVRLTRFVEDNNVDFIEDKRDAIEECSRCRVTQSVMLLVAAALVYPHLPVKAIQSEELHGSKVLLTRFLQALAPGGVEIQLEERVDG